ncbi:hypothetical protein ACPWT1_11270 [Ramlibacter sp. MMS24-I3-19]|uniref:hypothetical protein n=1 Tax=Ramlibacter sp. MMS24-I3-19 TaxID=3416606 RepID=UPI003CFC1853
MIRLVTAFVLALGLAAPALAQQPTYTSYALTVLTLQKMQAAAKEIEKKVGKKYDNDKTDNDKTDNDLSVASIEKMLNSVPEAKPILAKHGLSSKEYALATMAGVEAGMHLMFEPAMDKKGASQLMASYPRKRAPTSSCCVRIRSC